MREEKPSEKGTKVANIILGGSGLFCLIVLVYLIYHYSWTHEREFANPGSMLLYYGFPAVLAGLCFASLRLRSSHKINLALIIFSTGASIYAAEVIMTVWFSLPSVIAEIEVRDRVKTAKTFGVDFDTRSQLEVVDDLRKKGIEAYPTSHPPALFEKQADGSLKSKLTIGPEVLPLGWISNRVSILCNESGDYIIYESDEHGFHNPKGLWNNGRLEIVALGDSYAHGYCVPSDKNFVALIREHYPATLNLGMAGHGPLLMLATIKEYAQIVKPKVVLWFYYEGNDLKNLRNESSSPLLMRYTEDNFRQGLFNQQADIDRALMTYVEGVRDANRMSRRLEEIFEEVGNPRELLRRHKEIIRLNHLRQRLGLVLGRSGYYHPTENLSARSRIEMDLFGKILLQANESVSAWGGKLYFVYLPHWHRYAKPEVAERSRDQVLQTARTSGLHVIDIHEAFKAQKDPLALFPFRLHSHYNETGHRLVAEEVLQSISSDN